MRFRFWELPETWKPIHIGEVPFKFPGVQRCHQHPLTLPNKPGAIQFWFDTGHAISTIRVLFKDRVLASAGPGMGHGFWSVVWHPSDWIGSWIKPETPEEIKEWAKTWVPPHGSTAEVVIEVCQWLVTPLFTYDLEVVYNHIS